MAIRVAAARARRQEDKEERRRALLEAAGARLLRGLETRARALSRPA